MTGIAPYRVAVIGGGLAGITAALRCADGGAAVTLYESRPRLGGLTCSFRRGDLWVDNGQHVFLRCCTAYRSLLSRLGVADKTTLQRRLEVVVRSPATGGRLRRNALPAPLHLAGSLARYPWLNFGDRLRFVRAALALRVVDAADPATDLCSFGDWLRDHGQSVRAVHTLWELVGIATLNARADDVSLALAATVFQIGMLRGTSNGDIGWSAIPLQQLHGDAADDALAQAGARVNLRSTVRSLSRSQSQMDSRNRFRLQIISMPSFSLCHRQLRNVLSPVDALELDPRWSQRLGSSPIVNLHLILDRTVLETPFIAAVDSDVQWVFDRTRPKWPSRRPVPSGVALSR